MTSKYEGSDTKCNHGQACASVLPVFKLVDNHDFCFPAYGEQSDVIRAESWLSSQTVKCCGDPWEQYFLLSPSNKTQNTKHKSQSGPLRAIFSFVSFKWRRFLRGNPSNMCLSLGGNIFLYKSSKASSEKWLFCLLLLLFARITMQHWWMFNSLGQKN